jgi:hypothetical protein
MAKQPKIHTVYHLLESQGLFEANPANMGSRDQITGESLFKGPVQYPKMLYHPLGELRETNPGEWVDTPRGPQLRGQQFEIISQVVNTKAEENALRAEGWHDHPAKAIAAGGGIAPPTGASDRIAELEQKIAEMEAQAAAMREDESRLEDLQLGKAKPGSGKGLRPSASIAAEAE